MFIYSRKFFTKREERLFRRRYEEANNVFNYKSLQNISLAVSPYSAILRLGRALNNETVGGASGGVVAPKVQVDYPLNVPVLISAELAAPRRGARQLVRGHGRAKKPGKLVPRPRELRDDFERKSAPVSGRRSALAGHPVHTPPRRTCRGGLLRAVSYLWD